MTTIRRLLLATAVLVTGMANAAAQGAGGLIFDMAMPSLNPGFMPATICVEGIQTFGGYGYGVDEDDSIIGGFGVALIGSMDSSDGATGGFGGLIVGRRVIASHSFHLDLAARLGLGGAANHDSGYAMFYAEPYIELGLGLTKWMRLSGTIGYQLIGNILPGNAATEVLIRTPTIGLALSWGSF